MSFILSQVGRRRGLAVPRKCCSLCLLHSPVRSFSSQDVNNIRVEEEDNNINTDVHRRPRNKALAAIIRDGISALKSTTALIQRNKITRRPLFTPEADMNGPSDEQLAERKRLLAAAEQCLEEFSEKDRSLCLGGEPIALLEVQVNKTLSQATVFWTVPYGILALQSEGQLSEDNRLLLTDYMETMLESKAHILQRKIHSMLNFYYAPKVRFQRAPELMVHYAMDDLKI